MINPTGVREHSGCVLRRIEMVIDMAGPRLMGKHQVIGDDVKIGDETMVWHHVNLFGCEIGHDCKIGSFVEIGRGVKVGNFVKIEAHVFIPTGVTIEDYAFVGPGVSFTNDRFPRSAYFKENGEPALIDHFEIQPTLVKKGASIGSNCVICPGLTIGKGAMIGAGSVVYNDVPDYEVVVGNPARIKRRVRDEREYREFL